MNESKVINLVDHIEKNGQVNSFEKEVKKPIPKVTLTKRVYSFIIDIACIFTVHAAIVVAYAAFITDFYYSLSQASKVELLVLPIGAQLALFMASYIGYFMFTQVTMDGQTIGQKVYNLKVCDANGSKKDDLKTIALRTIAYTAYYFGLGVFQILFFANKEKRTFADTFSKSYIQTEYTDSNEESGEVIQIEIESLKSVG
jgi:uncharacterized RDD family membrane protein YckC